MGIERSAWERPGRIVARLARQAELALAEEELSLPQYRLMMYLDHQATAASKLADHLAVSRPSVTAVVDGLVARGLVARRPSDLDRRRVEHLLTDEGRQLLADADDRLDARLGDIASHLESAASEAAVSGLVCWKEALDAHRKASLGART